MGAPRYSDRFFGPDAPPGTGRLPADQPGDLVAATDLPAEPMEARDFLPPPTPPWHAHPVARGALVAALIVGASAGAYGWDQWRDRQSEIVARSSVDLSSEVMMFSFDPGLSTVTLSVRVRNDGPLPLTLSAVTPIDPRLSLVTEEFKAVELAPDQDFVKVLNLALDCDAPADREAAAEGEALVAHLRTVDGGEHEKRLSMNGLGLGYPTGLTEPCSYGPQQATFRDIYPETIQVARVSPDAVSAVVRLHTNWPDQSDVPAVDTVTAPTDAFDVTWEADSPGAGFITLTWSVGDCSQALTADDRQMRVELTGRMPTEDSPTQTTADASPTLIVELVRLAERVCT